MNVLYVAFNHKHTLLNFLAICKEIETTHFTNTVDAHSAVPLYILYFNYD